MTLKKHELEADKATASTAADTVVPDMAAEHTSITNVAEALSSKSQDEKASSSKTEDDAEAPMPQKKLTVLQSHGYELGRSIGSGSYAHVKVTFSDSCYSSGPKIADKNNGLSVS